MKGRRCSDALPLAGGMRMPTSCLTREHRQTLTAPASICVVSGRENPIAVNTKRRWAL
jgi:hypothetical protein